MHGTFKNNPFSQEGMTLRKILIATLGHVDHGKTSLLDKIRRTAVAKGEAGGITQAIGVSIIPLDTIKKICGKLLDVFKGSLTVPGLVAIDTPGHAAFTSLRKRGGSLADIAIVVIDINEGIMPQTKESLEILRANKVPFVIAANKIDLINGWSYDKSEFLLDNLQALDYKIQGELEKKTYDLIAQLNELNIVAERFDRISDYTKQFALVPLSAATGQGIPELLMVLMGLAQRFLEQKLHIEESGPAKGTILEVKEEVGLGVTLNTIVYNGTLHVNDTLIIGALEQPIVTKVRALLEPAALAELREKKSKFIHVKEVTAATGVKIAAPGMEKALAGMPLRSCSGTEEVKQLKQEVQQEIGEILSAELQEQGLIIRADTLGGLEALQHLLKEKNLPISSSALGDLTKKDLSEIETMKEKNESLGVLLGFNVKISPELQKYAESKNLKIILSEVIYRLLEEYDAYTQGLKKEIELREFSSLVRPCKFMLLKGYLFRQSNPAIVGIDIEVGKLKAGDPLMDVNGRSLSKVKSLQEGQETVHEATQGKQLALAMDNITIGRQVQLGDFLYTDVPEHDFKKLKEFKKLLSSREIEVLKEIAEIKRKDNPVWGVG